MRPTLPSDLTVTTLPTPWGRALAAASAQGLHALWLGDDDAALLTLWRRAWGHPAPLGVLPTAWQAVLREVLAHPGTPCPLPLAPQGSPFQQRVWAALHTIAPGQTLSYGALAARLGMPNAARAVANACARNPLAIVIPCHRVVGADGRLSGYRWGLARKRALLQAEAASARPT
ncbi:MAG: methylated-DNA--[protein]-cysteine S-methyltransferase [Tepidimonas ignava]